MAGEAERSLAGIRARSDNREAILNTDWLALCAVGFQVLILPVALAVWLVDPLMDILDVLAEWWMGL
jgi:hypothetical protein